VRLSPEIPEKGVPAVCFKQLCRPGELFKNKYREREPSVNRERF
jgi:hypothetical protein